MRIKKAYIRLSCFFIRQLDAPSAAVLIDGPKPTQIAFGPTFEPCEVIELEIPTYDIVSIEMPYLHNVANTTHIEPTQNNRGILGRDILSLQVALLPMKFLLLASLNIQAAKHYATPAAPHHRTIICH